MAEVFATVGGVASLIDVALRACSKLYDSSRYLKEAPQLSQRLRRTIQSVESVLKNLDDFITLHRQQQTSSGEPDLLPSAVENEVISIKAELDALSALLPASSSTGHIRAKFKWVLDRKKVTEVIQSLDRHQNTLTLALQSFAQSNDSRTHQDLLRRLEGNHLQHKDTSKNIRDEIISVHARLDTNLANLTQTSQVLLPAQEALRSGLTNLYGTLSAGQDTIADRLDGIGTTLSQLQIRSNHLQSSTILTAPTEDVLARIFRAELQRVIVPAVQQCLSTVKASPDHRLDEIKQKIDEMAQQLGSESHANKQHNVKMSDRSLSQTSSTPSHIQEKCQDLAQPIDSSDLRMTAFAMPGHRSQPQCQLHRKWTRTWTFEWAIGTLRVSVSTSVTRQKISPDYRAGRMPPPQKSYQISIEFVPAPALIQLRGLRLSIENKRDQRGFYQICPLISTFAIVPDDAEVIKFVKENDVEAIQLLFLRGLAAPNDRDPSGRTLIMVLCSSYDLISGGAYIKQKAVNSGNLDTYQFLFDQGADCLATDAIGWSVIDYAIIKSSDYERVPFTDLLQLAQSEMVDVTQQRSVILPIILLHIARNPRSKHQESSLFLWLKQLGFSVDDLEASSPAVFYWIDASLIYSDTKFPVWLKSALQIFLALGGDISARCGRLSPLQYLFDLYWQASRSRDINPEIILDIATALLENGAELFALDHRIPFAFKLAEYLGLASGFSLAIQRAGYNLDEVMEKMDYLQWVFRNPNCGIAKSTAVDSSQVALSSTTGLTSRKAIIGDRLED